jgi:hypothetical protein
MSSHQLYQNHTTNIKEQSEINHSNHKMLQEPEHGDGHDANYDHWSVKSNILVDLIWWS